MKKRASWFDVTLQEEKQHEGKADKKVTMDTSAHY